MKRILLMLGAALTLAIAAACGPGAGNSPSFQTNTTGPSLAPTMAPSDMESEMPSESIDLDGESPAAS